MNGKVVRVSLVLLILAVVCLFSVPVFSEPVVPGEHPWGSDRTSDGTLKTGSTSYQDSVAMQGSSAVTGTLPSGGGVLIVQIVLSASTSLNLIW